MADLRQIPGPSAHCDARRGRAPAVGGRRGPGAAVRRPDRGPGLAGQPRPDLRGRPAARGGRGSLGLRHGQQLGRPALREPGHERLLRRARRHPDGVLPRPAEPAGARAGRRHPDPGHRRRALPGRLGGRGRRPAPVGRTVGRGGLAVRADRGVHGRALHRVAVLRRGLLGVGAGPSQPVVGGGPARVGGLHAAGLRALPGRGPVRPDPDHAAHRLADQGRPRRLAGAFRSP